MILKNFAQLQRRHAWLLREHERATQQAAEDGKQAGLETVQRFPRFKPKTGGVQRATKAKIIKLRSGRRLVMSNDHPAARPLDKGSRPHVIVPRRKKFLRFVSRSGSVVFTKRVRHPGNRPYRFLWGATTTAHRLMGARMRQSMTRIARKF